MPSNELTIEEYVQWANTLDSTGADSTEAHNRLSDPETAEMVYKAIRDTIAMSQRWDLIKKWVFYGKTFDPNKSTVMVEFGADPNPNELRCAYHSTTHNTIRLLHALAGLTTETGELFELYFDAIYRGGTIDWENYDEEVGDLFWYMALLTQARNYASFIPFMLGNRAKLIKRYGSTWTQQAALNRNTKAEMQVMTEAMSTQELTNEFPDDQQNRLG